MAEGSGGLPKATWRVSMGGTDLTDRFAPRLISLTLREGRGDEADQIDIVVGDHDGRVDIPPTGVEIAVELGWERGANLPLGLIPKGLFMVDEVGHAGPPDQLTIRARSADFTQALKKRKERAAVNKTVGQIISAIAAENKLTAQVHEALTGLTIPAMAGEAMSDAALLKALGRRFDACAAIKNKRLIFAPIGAGQTATGKALPKAAIDRSDTTGRHSYGRVDRENVDGVEAVWYDPGSARRETVTVGDGGSSKAIRLRQVYATADEARQAAQAEYNRKSRAVARMTVNLALGRPDYSPDTEVTLSGYKADINARAWLCAELTHTMDGGGGLTTAMTLESAL